jgi:hypothetical protein
MVAAFQVRSSIKVITANGGIPGGSKRGGTGSGELEIGILALIPCASGGNGAAPVCSVHKVEGKVPDARWRSPKRFTYFSATARISSPYRQTKPGRIVLGAACCTQGSNKSSSWAHKDPVSALIEPEPIIRGINDKGYYIWRDACWTQRRTHWLAATTTFALALWLKRRE